MSDDATDPRIRIQKVWVQRGTRVDDHNLIGCYFEEGDPDKYHFYGKQGDLIQTIPDVITSDTVDFKFIRDGVLWTVDPFHLDAPLEIANGHWSNTRGTDDDDGEFHAQAGPGAGEEEESASSATA